MSNTRKFVEYVLIAFGSYLLLSLVIAIIGDYGYKEVLRTPYQIYGVFFIYWWTPIPRMVDLSEK